MKISKDERALFSKMGKLGGVARAKKLSAAKRKSIAKKAGAARWAKQKKTDNQ